MNASERGRQSASRSRMLAVPLGLTLVLSACASPGSSEPEAPPEIESRVKGTLDVDGQNFRDLNDDGELDPYEDWRLAPAERVSNLVEQMTLEEKAGLMLIDTLNAECADQNRAAVPDHAEDYVTAQHMHRFVFRNVVTGEDEAECGEDDDGFAASTSVTPAEAAEFTNSVQELSEESRLGIPALFKSNARNHIDPDARAGINEAAGAFTTFPKEAGIAAAALGAEAAATGEPATTGDMTVVEDFAEVMGEEWESIGLRGMYGYMADLSTEPRWYRTHETFTENGPLAADIMETLVGSLQGPVDPDGVSLSPESPVALTLKHFPGGGPQELGMDPHYSFGKSQVYPGDAFGEHLLPFESAIEAGVASIMPYYGIPMDVTHEGQEYSEEGFAFSEEIISELLRDDLGFSGYVNSDTGIINDRAWGLEDMSVPERVAASINSGTDTLSGFNDVAVILDLVDDGLVTQERVDEAAERLLAPMFQMGLFEDPYVDPEVATATFGAEQSHATGLDVQRDSLVLLQNETSEGNATLPLDPGSDVYVLGDYDADTVADYGFDVTDGNVDEGAQRPSAEDSDYVLISLTARNESADYISDDEEFGLNAEHANPSVVEGVKGMDGESPYGAADACVAYGAEECTDDGLIFGGAYPWETSIIDFTGMQGAESWEVVPSLETIQEVMAEVDDPSKVVLDVYFRQPYVLDEDSGLLDAGAILAGFGMNDTALLDVLSGEHAPQGKLPFALPSTRQAVLDQDSDSPGYNETEDGALFDFGHGLTYEESNESTAPPNEEGE